jgi:hypothetical protein
VHFGKEIFAFQKVICKPVLFASPLIVGVINAGMNAGMI